MDRRFYMIAALFLMPYCQGLDLNLSQDAAAVPGQLPQPSQREDQVDGGSLTYATSLQLLSSLQQLIAQSATGVEEKIESFQRRIEDRLLSLENRMEDKIDNNNNLNELIRLDVKISRELAHFREEAKEDILGSLESLNNQTHTLNTILESGGIRDQCDMQSSVRDLKSVMADIARPSNCSRGMVIVLSEGSFPYPVIYPREESDFDFPHLCDTLTDNGGWIIIQRRATGNTEFNRNWAEYKHGFGSFDNDFWLGNDKIHTITSRGTFELRVVLKYRGKTAFAHYESFSVANEHHNYILTIGRYHGTAGDSLRYHHGRPFSTADRHNDGGPVNCASDNGGGWWFGQCDHSNLNGNWARTTDHGVEWTTFAAGTSVSFSEMKIRLVE